MLEAAVDGVRVRRAGVLLAAGASTRMGRPKALLAWGGSTLLDYALDQYALAGVTPAVVVVGAHREMLEPAAARHSGVSVVVNPDYTRGRSSSIAVGAGVLAGTGLALNSVIIQSVDQPCRARVLDRLCATLETSTADAAIPTFDGRRGHPIALSGRLLPELLTVNEADLGLRAVMLRHADATRGVEVDAPEVLSNLNDPAAYAAAYAAAGWQ